MAGAHLAPDRCYVCGGTEAEHEPRIANGGMTSHSFWSNADAAAEFGAEEHRTRVRYANGVSTPEAAYVAEHRPY